MISNQGKIKRDLSKVPEGYPGGQAAWNKLSNNQREKALNRINTKSVAKSVEKPAEVSTLTFPEYPEG